MPTFEKGEALVSLELGRGRHIGKRIRSSVMAAESLAVLYYSLNRHSSVRNPILESALSQGLWCARIRNLSMAILDDERS